MKKSLTILFLLFLLLTACAPGKITDPEKTPTSAITPTPTPTLPPDSQPESNTTPNFHKLSGSLVWKNNDAAIVGADVFLCKMLDQWCFLYPSVKAITNDKGYFEFTELQPGIYVFLYDNSGLPDPPSFKIDFRDESYKCFVEWYFKNTTPNCQNEIPFFKKGSITLAEGTGLRVMKGGSYLVEGSIFSDEFGLNLWFENGKPISIDFGSEDVSNFIVRVWESPKSIHTPYPTSTPVSLPTGIPLSSWQDFPIMLNATSGLEVDDTHYEFAVKATINEIRDYYNEENKKNGWSEETTPLPGVICDQKSNPNRCSFMFVNNDKSKMMYLVIDVLGEISYVQLRLIVMQ